MYSTDTDFVFEILGKGPATTNQILRQSFQERGVGLTVHSRISELRKKLEADSLGRTTITCQRLPKRPEQAKPDFQYEIVTGG